MNEARSDDQVAIAFLKRRLLDQARGVEKDLAHYLREFPGHDTVIAQEYLRAVAEESSDDANNDGNDAQMIGPYRIVAEIGRGGQGIVYAADDTRVTRRVALKVIETGGAAAADVVARFRREAEAAARIDHPGISTLYEVGKDGRAAWIAMRFVEGENLAAHTRRRGGAVATRDELHAAILLIEKVARAVHAAHEKGIIHRDLKPGNIMVTPTSEPVVLDFGLARFDENTGPSLTLSGEVLGTPAFMAPEQIDRKFGVIDRRTDVWALGVTLVTTLSGQTPFAGPTQESIIRNVLEADIPNVRTSFPFAPDDLETVVLTALERDQARRYASAADFAEDLARVIAGEPIAARPPSFFRKLRRFAAKRPATAAAAIVGVVAVISLFSLTATFLFRERELRISGDETLRELEHAADLKDADDLLAEARTLFPIVPELTERCRSWSLRVDDVLGRRATNRTALDHLEHRNINAKSREWFETILRTFLLRCDELETAKATIERRSQSARATAETAGVAADAKWKGCIADIAGSDRYGRIRIEREPDLLPLEKNERTGLWEFWHIPSGKIPKWNDDDEEYEVAEDSGIVLVALPGGTFEMGAVRTNVSLIDGAAVMNEIPVQPVTLAPFFISKFEMTQGQWLRATEGQNPASFHPGTTFFANLESADARLDFPIETIAWSDANDTLFRYRMQLPTEAQWEYACRAGTKEGWCFGNNIRMGPLYSNFSIREGLDKDEDGIPKSDGFVLIAPVGRFRPNAFGLHDFHGNVWEWCRDRFVKDYSMAPARPGDGEREFADQNAARVLRGGGWRNHPLNGRSSARNYAPAGAKNEDLGVRPARDIRIAPTQEK